MHVHAVYTFHYIAAVLKNLTPLLFNTPYWMMQNSFLFSAKVVTCTVIAVPYQWALAYCHGQCWGSKSSTPASTGQTGLASSRASPSERWRQQHMPLYSEPCCVHQRGQRVAASVHEVWPVQREKMDISACGNERFYKLAWREMRSERLEMEHNIVRIIITIFNTCTYLFWRLWLLEFLWQVVPVSLHILLQYNAAQLQGRAQCVQQSEECEHVLLSLSSRMLIWRSATLDY